MGIRTPLLKPAAPMRKRRPTPVAQREMRKCRKLLGLPRREPRR